MILRVLISLLVIATLISGQTNYQGTNTVAQACSASEALACSSATTECTTTDSTQADATGTADATDTELRVDGGSSNCLCFWAEADAVNDAAAWPSGNWTFRFEIVTANTAVTWETMDICRMNAACTSQIGSDLASVSSIGQQLGTGVQSRTASASASSAGNASDIWLITAGCSAGGMGPNRPSIEWSQLIDTPVTEVVGARRRGGVSVVGED